MSIRNIIMCISCEYYQFCIVAAHLFYMYARFVHVNSNIAPVLRGVYQCSHKFWFQCKRKISALMFEQVLVHDT